MNVYIANFGQANFYWAHCLEKSVIALMDEKGSFEFIHARDKQGFIQYALKNITTVRGEKPTVPVASRWYGLSEIIRETDGDIWIHRAGDDLFWTRSTDGPLEFLDYHDPHRNWEIVITEKPCTGWQKKDANGRSLNWNALHPKAKDFLFTESTYQKLNPDYAEYATDLVQGSLEAMANFHSRDEWKKKEGNAKHGVVHVFSAKDKTIHRMVTTALQTCKNANGQLVEKRMKDKGFMFASEKDMAEHLSLLWDDQGGICALTGLQMVPDGEEDAGWHRCSLDRIDSDGHYEAGNLQLVCKFANMWKSNMPNETFLALIEQVRAP